MTETRVCQACGETIPVRWSDGVPLPSDDVHVMYPFDDSGPLILHGACDKGDEESPQLLPPASR